MNKVYLHGFLGDDAELKVTGSGQAIMKMRMATTERWRDQSGERKERTDWHTVIMWGKRAEGLAQYLRKGSEVIVEGQTQTRSYETDTGDKRYVTEIKAANIEFCGKRGGGNGDTPQRRPTVNDDQDDAPFGGSDDIPF